MIGVNHPSFRAKNRLWKRFFAVVVGASDIAQANQPVIDRRPAAIGSPSEQRHANFQPESGTRTEASRVQQPSGVARQPPRVGTPARGQQQQVGSAPPTRASSSTSGPFTATPEVQTSILPRAATTTTFTTSVNDSTSMASQEQRR